MPAGLRKHLRICIALMLAGTGVASAQLPVPSGSFRVGRVTYSWSYPSWGSYPSSSIHPSPAKEHVGSATDREFVVYVWYPAARTTRQSPTAEYVDQFLSVQAVVPAPVLEQLFRPAPYSKLHSQLPVTHAVTNAGIAPGSARYPLVLFSHGLGNPTAIYTAEIEDLVSHGYIVAAIEHPPDTAFTILSSGAIVRYAQDEWSAASAKPGGYVAHVKQRIDDAWVPDIKFTLDQLLRLDSGTPPKAPFAGRLDRTKIAALGHSMGGLATVRACQVDARIRACINQDADVAGSPFPDQLHEDLKQPLLYFTAATSNVFRDSFTHPSEKELADMGTTRAQYDQDVARVQKNQNDAMAGVAGGSYRIVIDIPSFIHRTFSDLPLLEARYDNSKAEQALANFRLAESYTLAFLDRYLKGQSGKLLDQPSPYEGVRVDRSTTR
jgi:alpha-beta hydrolase superfamily lysophospholipase